MLISKASQTVPGNSLYLVHIYSGKFFQKDCTLKPRSQKKEGWVVS